MCLPILTDYGNEIENNGKFSNKSVYSNGIVNDMKFVCIDFILRQTFHHGNDAAGKQS